MFSIFLIVLIIGTGSSNARYIRTVSDLVQSTDADFIENPIISLSSNLSASEVAENKNDDEFKDNSNLKLISTNNCDENAARDARTENPTDLVTILENSNPAAESDGGKIVETMKVDGNAETHPESVATKTIAIESSHGKLDDANVGDEVEKTEDIVDLDLKRTTIADTVSVSDVSKADNGKVSETIESRTTAETINEEFNERMVDGIKVADTTNKADVAPLIPSANFGTENVEQPLENRTGQEDTAAVHIVDATEVDVNQQAVRTKAAEDNSKELSVNATETLPSEAHPGCATTKTITLDSSFDSVSVTPATVEFSSFQETNIDELPTNGNTQYDPLKSLDVSRATDPTSDTNVTTKTVKIDTTLNLLNTTSDVQSTGSTEQRNQLSESEVTKEIKEPLNSFNLTAHKTLPEENKNTETPIEKPQQRVYEIPRPIDVQPSKDAIEDLIEEVIGTLNAPLEVEELIEKEIVDSMRGISATESWHEIKPAKPLIEFRSSDLFQKAQTIHDKEEEKEEEEEDISNEIANSLHEVSYLLPSSAEQKKEKVNAQLKNTETKHALENDKVNQKLVDASLTESEIPRERELGLELSEDDNEVIATDKISEKIGHHQANINDMSDIQPYIASVSLEESKADTTQDLAIRLTEPAIEKLDSHPVTPNSNEDINLSKKQKELESDIKAVTPQSVQEKQHYDRILTFVINYGVDATSAERIETNTIADLKDGERQNQVVAADVPSTPIQDSTSLNQIKVKDVPHDPENISPETSSASMKSIELAQNITADTKGTKKTALDLAETLNEVVPTENVNEKKINLEPSVSVKEKGFKQELEEDSIIPPANTNNSLNLHSKSADVSILDKKSVTDEATETANQVEKSGKNIPTSATVRSTPTAEENPFSVSSDASVTAEPVHAKFPDEERFQPKKDTLLRTVLIPTENAKSDSLITNGILSNTNELGSVVPGSNIEAVPRSKQGEDNVSPKIEAKNLPTHLSTGDSASAGSATPKTPVQTYSKTTKMESSEEDIALTTPVKEAESSSIESQEHSLDSAEYMAAPVVTFSLNLGVTVNSNDTSKPTEHFATGVLSTDLISNQSRETVIPDVTLSPKVVSFDSGSPREVNHALRYLPVSVTDSPSTGTVDAKESSHPITTIIYSPKASINKDQNKTIPLTQQPASSEETDTDSYEHPYPTLITTATTNADLSPAELQKKIKDSEQRKESSEEKEILTKAAQFENHSFESVENFEDSEEDQRDDFVQSTQRKESLVAESVATVDHRSSLNSGLDTKPIQADAENELDLSSASYQMDEEDSYRSQINSFEEKSRSFSFADYPHPSETDNQLIFHGRSMYSEDIILPSLHSSDFVPTKVEFDTVGLLAENQKSSEGNERASPNAPENSLVEAIVEAAELTTEMNRIFLTFRPSLASNGEISVSATESTRDTINTKVVESRFLAINSADHNPQIASINVTIAVILSITLLTLIIVLLTFFGIRMRNRHGDLNIEMLEQQGNTCAAVTSPPNARNPL